MSTEENKAIASRIIEIWNQENLSVVDEIFAPDCVRHASASSDLSMEGFKQSISTFRTIFPDLHLTVEDVIAEGDKVAMRGTGRGTQKAAWGDIPATGKLVTYSWINISRLANGKIVELWAMPDALGILQQLGAVQSMGESEG